MRISELAERTNVPLPTLKFYVREGLLRGRTTAPNQAVYDERHVDRVRLIGALTGAAAMSLAQARAVLEVLDDGVDPVAAMGRAVATMTPATDDPVTHSGEARRLGIQVPEDYPAVQQLDAAAAAVQAAGLPWNEEIAARYIAPLRQLAAAELMPLSDMDRGEAVAYAVLGTALYEPVILALRRLLHAELVIGGDAPTAT
ncbi:MerR family transcriptional regulator [Microbacterium sp. RG1]|uniref:MerR family transcriptional regulator n=1 Tax=Microbacterium sp. RG1 TaxID=2489212 RepID=UPI0010CA27FD|nr:MerR family transcriptional regulator [Microbacterium sp. RG1]QCQ17444.1 MerR family transcriptional regulator [Microbacterium sp. RG1]